MRSVNPPGDEEPVAARLGASLSDGGLETEILTSPGGRANLVARVPGPRDRPALVLLSHSDVVPVEEQLWHGNPFDADVVDGVLWGRGSLDMKGIAVMHAVAAVELARSARTPTREVILVMVADEEAGGDHGACWLLEAHADRVGFAAGQPPPEVISEGGYGLSGTLQRTIVPIALGEKTALWFDVVVEGAAGHGALPPPKQAAVALAAIVRDIAGFGSARIHPVLREQFARLTPAASGAPAVLMRALASPAGGVVARATAAQLRKASAFGMLLADSITPTIVHAGYKANVVPGEARASFDCRLLPDTDPDAFLARMEKKARRRGGRVDNVVRKGYGPVSDKGPLYSILEEASPMFAPDAVTTPALTPTITDLRFFRARGAKGYGWCPLVLTPELLAGVHGHDERVPVADFENAVTVMTEVVRRAAS
jgi:acetylornithine deacetylase/succinyl-diaminopimelate desuccinylase-like protein